MVLESKLHQIFAINVLTIDKPSLAVPPRLLILSLFKTYCEDKPSRTTIPCKTIELFYKDNAYCHQCDTQLNSS